MEPEMMEPAGAGTSPLPGGSILPPPAIKLPPEKRFRAFIGRIDRLGDEYRIVVSSCQLVTFDEKRLIFSFPEGFKLEQGRKKFRAPAVQDALRAFFPGPASVKVIGRKIERSRPARTQAPKPSRDNMAPDPAVAAAAKDPIIAATVSRFNATIERVVPPEK